MKSISFNMEPEDLRLMASALKSALNEMLSPISRSSPSDIARVEKMLKQAELESIYYNQGR